MQPPQKRQPRRRLPFKQDHNQREARRRLGPFFERFVVFKDLPITDAVRAHEEDEGVRVGNLLRKLCRPRAAQLQMRRCEEDVRAGVLSFNGELEAFRQRLIRRVIAEKPTSHSHGPRLPAAHLSFQPSLTGPSTQ